MGVVRSYATTALNDAAIPHLRGPVEALFDQVVVHRGIPTRQDYRDLRNRVDMLEYNAREAARKVNELRAQVEAVRKAATERS